jgi:hypothetical protein
MTSEIVKWMIVAMMAFSALGVVNAVGKPVQPISPKVATRVVAVNAAYIAAIILWWH